MSTDISITVDPERPAAFEGALAAHDVAMARCVALGLGYVQRKTRYEHPAADVIVLAHDPLRVTGLLDGDGNRINWALWWAEEVVSTLGALDDRCRGAWVRHSERREGERLRLADLEDSLLATDLVIHHTLFLDLRHLPRDLAIDGLDEVDGAVADQLEDGWLLDVPVDERGWIEGYKPNEPIPPEIVAVWRLARRWGCDQVRFHRNGFLSDALPRWEW